VLTAASPSSRSATGDGSGGSGGGTGGSSAHDAAAPAAAAPAAATQRLDGCCPWGWIRALAVISFDVSSGHTLEVVAPPGALDEDDRARIRMPAMPDCNVSGTGDFFYCFRVRKSRGLPLFSSSLLEQTFEYCYSLFRQERNAGCARGYFQKSVVLVTRHPYVNLFERLVKVSARAHTCTLYRQATRRMTSELRVE
jgi:hypothetical protein